MKTKIAIVTTLAFLITANVFAQTSGVSFGVRAGVNFQNLTGKYSNGDKFTNKLIPGFNIGANAEIPIATDFYIQPGLLFSTKGAKWKESDVKTTLSYVEVPINFLYKPALGAGKLLLGFGPYVAFGVGSSNIDFGTNPSEIKRFDAGGNLLAGYEFSNKLSFQLNTGLGLINIANREAGDNKSSIKNTGFGISAGYRFN
jgi:hypothetical protein